MPTRRLQLPDWVRRRHERERQPHPNISRGPAPQPPRFDPRDVRRGLAMRRTMRGITPARQRDLLLKIVEERHRRHVDPADPFRLPQYRHPLARRRAREARR